MKHLIFLLPALFMQNLQAQTDSMRSILVTGMHETEVVPDEIILNVTLSEYYEEEFMPGTRYEDYKTRHPLDDIENQFDEAMKEAKIKDDQITVQDTGNHWRPWGKEGLQTKQYKISVPDFECATKVQQALQFKGVQSFQIAELKHKDKHQIMMETKNKALLNAREKAESMAATLGEGIGRPITIVEIVASSGYQPFRAARSMELLSSDAGGGNNDTFGNTFKKLKIVQRVEVRFELSVAP